MQGLVPKIGFGLIAFVFSLLLLGRVENHAVEPYGVSVRIADDPPVLGDTADTAIGVDQPVVHGVGRAALEHVPHGFINQVAVVRMEQLTEIHSSAVQER